MKDEGRHRNVLLWERGAEAEWEREVRFSLFFPYQHEVLKYIQV